MRCFFFFFLDDIQKVINYIDEHLEVYLDPKYRQNEQVEHDVIARVKSFYFGNEKMDENALSETISVREIMTNLEQRSS